MKRVLLFLLMFISAAISMDAQRNISGTITDTDGLPLIGANVVVKGTSVGTITDIDGSFAFEAPDDASTLVATYTGFETQEIDISNTDNVNIVMSEGTLLDEVVVTALGIEKDAKTLGYAVDNVKGDELTKARESNIVNALQGKVTGVNIGNTGGNLGGSSKIIIRGATSLSGNNDPLWVVDGVPINNDQFVSNGTRISGNRDFSNGAAVINPDDVESMSVLKGAAATALYGSRAAAGAIIVTTKSGKANKDGSAKIEYNVSYRVDDLFVTPDYQQEYAMGDFAKYDSSSIGFDWGPRITGQTVNSLPITNESGPLTTRPNNGINDFFRTGRTVINGLSIADAGAKFNYRLSLGALNQTGLLPGAELDRYNAGINAGIQHSERFRTTFGLQFAKTMSRGTGATGANDPNIVGLSSFSSTLDPRNFNPWIDEAGNQINQAGPTSNNYLWLRNENRNDRDDTRIIGNISSTFKILDNLSLRGTYGYDFDQDNRFFSNRKGTIQRLQGDYTIDNINNVQQNLDVILNYNASLGSRFEVSALAGYNWNNRKRQDEGFAGVNLLIPELFAPGNTEQTIPARFFSNRTLFGAYGSVDMTFDGWATLTVTGRNDWSSTLPQDNNSYFYPSVSTAFVLTEALGIESSFLSYAKFRGSFAQVGNDTGPYQLDFLFNPVTVATGQYGLNINFPFNDRLAFSKGNVIPPENLRPEQQTSYELGAELDFFDYRLGLDVAVFRTENRDQILALPIPESTGFGFLRTNVGQVNTRGLEIALDATPISMPNFTWNTAVNYSSAQVEVVELSENVDRVLLASAFSSVQVVAEVGSGFELFAIPFLKDSTSGRPLIDPNTGARLAGEAQAMGSVLPDFTMGFVNSFDLGPVNLSFTIDWRSGGVMKSSTVDGLQTGGLAQETLLNRDGTFIDREGVIMNADGTVRDNDVPLASAADFWQSLDDNSVSEAFIFDASFVKLREASLSYSLPKRLFSNNFLNGVTLGVEGRNLALLWSVVPHIDPENNLFGSGADGFGVERASVPTPRSIGVNLRASF
ncbi:SusC/RagA family TonB-linked outer membrane protein [Portibacter marinus]|uniref:SusC/RagA family TonB-linked outer membrane protein n=1 Tax=Portibacter marinus TaxID=2898660 RepID=UPI001F479160|nr:SusC/RagA family TonB-linked outer membrane protein [Portibacter marinus]